MSAACCCMIAGAGVAVLVALFSGGGGGGSGTSTANTQQQWTGGSDSSGSNYVPRHSSPVTHSAGRFRASECVFIRATVSGDLSTINIGVDPLLLPATHPEGPTLGWDPMGEVLSGYVRSMNTDGGLSYLGANTRQVPGTVDLPGMCTPARTPGDPLPEAREALQREMRSRSCIPRSDQVAEGSEVTLKWDNGLKYVPDPTSTGSYTLYEPTVVDLPHIDSILLRARAIVDPRGSHRPGSVSNLRVTTCMEEFVAHHLKSGATQAAPGGSLCEATSAECGGSCFGVCKNCPQPGFCMCYPEGYVDQNDIRWRDASCILPPGETGGRTVPPVASDQPKDVRDAAHRAHARRAHAA